MKLEKKKIQNLIRIAADARKFSYAPYSHFAVGAALLGADSGLHLVRVPRSHPVSTGRPMFADRAKIFIRSGKGGDQI